MQRCIFVIKKNETSLRILQMLFTLCSNNRFISSTLNDLLDYVLILKKSKWIENDNKPGLL